MKRFEKKRGGGCICVYVCMLMCGCVNVHAPTCSGVDKLQNQGPAGDNARSTRQKIPEEKEPIKTHYSALNRSQCNHWQNMYSTYGYRWQNGSFTLRLFSFEILKYTFLKYSVHTLYSHILKYRMSCNQVLQQYKIIWPDKQPNSHIEELHHWQGTLAFKNGDVTIS